MKVIFTITKKIFMVIIHLIIPFYKRGESLFVHISGPDNISIVSVFIVPFSSCITIEYIAYETKFQQKRPSSCFGRKVLCVLAPCTAEKPVQVSGIYPHLAMYNNEGECGTGAVVPWAGKLWVITYGPHLPKGSSDKLYSISKELVQTIHPESVGGTPANRMIHKESKQLFIGPYAIGEKGNVRVIPYSRMPGRHTPPSWEGAGSMT